jgi:hypothetical protein
LPDLPTKQLQFKGKHNPASVFICDQDHLVDDSHLRQLKADGAAAKRVGLEIGVTADAIELPVSFRRFVNPMCLADRVVTSGFVSFDPLSTQIVE